MSWQIFRPKKATEILPGLYQYDGGSSGTVLYTKRRDRDRWTQLYLSLSDEKGSAAMCYGAAALIAVCCILFNIGNWDNLINEFMFEYTNGYTWLWVGMLLLPIFTVILVLIGLRCTLKARRIKAEMDRLNPSPPKKRRKKK